MSVRDALVVTRSKPSPVLTYVTAAGEIVKTTMAVAEISTLELAAPVREFSSYARQRHYTGLYWCATTRSHLAYESLMERDRMLLADFDPAVTAVVAQPFHVSGSDDESQRNRIPDLLLVETGGGARIVDVKPVSKVFPAPNAPLIQMSMPPEPR